MVESSGLCGGSDECRQGRNFAKAANQQAKTDQVDAQVLAWFGDKITPDVRPLASEAQQQLDDLVTRRQLVDILTAERNRSDFVREMILASP